MVQHRAGGYGLVGGDYPFFHFLFFIVTTELQNWEGRGFAFSGNRKLAGKMGLSKRWLRSINNRGVGYCNYRCSGLAANGGREV